MVEITQVKISILSRNPVYVDEKEFKIINDAIQFLSAYGLIIYGK